jgi:hypothetical protein
MPRTSFKKPALPTQNTWVKVGKVGVDSGQIMIGDPCYIGNKFDDSDSAIPENRKSMRYSSACIASLTDKQCGVFGNDDGGAFCTSSGYGDGAYGVFVKYIGHRIAEVKVVFITNNANI